MLKCYNHEIFSLCHCHHVIKFSLATFVNPKPLLGTVCISLCILRLLVFLFSLQNIADLLWKFCRHNISRVMLLVGEGATLCLGCLCKKEYHKIATLQCTEAFFKTVFEGLQFKHWQWEWNPFAVQLTCKSIWQIASTCTWWVTSSWFYQESRLTL